MGIEFRFAEELNLKSNDRILVLNPPKNLPLPPSITIFEFHSFNQIQKNTLHAILIFIDSYTYFFPFLKQYQALLNPQGALWIGYLRNQEKNKAIERKVLTEKLSPVYFPIKKISFEGIWNVIGYQKK